MIELDQKSLAVNADRKDHDRVKGQGEMDPDPDTNIASSFKKRLKLSKFKQ